MQPTPNEAAGQAGTPQSSPGDEKEPHGSRAMHSQVYQEAHRSTTRVELAGSELTLDGKFVLIVRAPMLNVEGHRPRGSEASRSKTSKNHRSHGRAE